MNNILHLIKDRSKVVSFSTKQKFQDNEGLTTYETNVIVKDGVKLSDAFKYLPYGIIDKSVTGIGGTTLELKSKRNSIIVEPLRAIAASKAAENTSDYIYIGGAFGQFTSRIKEENIVKYLIDNSIEYKKILVVADSLPYLIEILLKTLGDKIYTTFHLIIDEIDSFQNDSSFRESLERCIDIYKKFNQENRILITATLLSFSDEALKNESITTINYKNNPCREITLIHTSTLELLAADKISQLLSKDDSSKIVVACNHFEFIRKIISDLEKNFNVDSREISILCSPNSKISAGDYYAQLQDNILPGRVNFITSAYFTGVDINENYHSFAISSYNIPNTLLSNHKLKQIIGRCRKEILSETVLYTTKPYSNNKEVEYNVEILLSIAKTNLLAVQCIESQYKRNPYLKKYLIEKKQDLTQLFDYSGFKLIRKDISGYNVISYFNIDAFLENQRIKLELYADRQQLKTHLLKEGHKVTQLEFDSHRKVSSFDTNLNFPEKAHLKADAFAILETIGDDVDLMDRITSETIYPSIYKDVFDIYGTLLNYFTPKKALEKTRQFASDRDNKEYKNYLEALKFFVTSDEDTYKSEILLNFKIGETVTNEEIQKRLLKIFEKYSLPAQSIEKPISALRLFNCYFDSKDRKKVGHRIVGLNPKKITVDNMYFFKKDGEIYIDFDKITEAQTKYI